MEFLCCTILLPPQVFLANPAWHAVSVNRAAREEGCRAAVEAPEQTAMLFSLRLSRLRVAEAARLPRRILCRSKLASDLYQQSKANIDLAEPLILHPTLDQLS